MSANLQTIAHFGDPMEAELACARLQDEGVNAVVTGHEVGGIFGPGFTLGGLQLMVPAEECERAEGILTDLAKEIEARKHRPKEAIMAEPPPDEVPETPEDIAARPNAAEEMTERAFRASLFGFIIFSPLIPVAHVYALVLLAKVTFGDKPTRGAYRVKYLVALALSVPSVLVGSLFLLAAIVLCPSEMLAIIALVVGTVAAVMFFRGGNRPATPEERVETS
jgi:hypothetical protein